MVPFLFYHFEINEFSKNIQKVKHKHKKYRLQSRKKTKNSFAEIICVVLCHEVNLVWVFMVVPRFWPAYRRMAVGCGRGALRLNGMDINKQIRSGTRSEENLLSHVLILNEEIDFSTRIKNYLRVIEAYLQVLESKNTKTMNLTFLQNRF